MVQNTPKKYDLIRNPARFWVIWKIGEIWIVEMAHSWLDTSFYPNLYFWKKLERASETIFCEINALDAQTIQNPFMRVLRTLSKIKFQSKIRPIHKLGRYNKYASYGRAIEASLSSKEGAKMASWLVVCPIHFQLLANLRVWRKWASPSKSVFHFRIFHFKEPCVSCAQRAVRQAVRIAFDWPYLTRTKWPSSGTAPRPSQQASEYEVAAGLRKWH